MDTDWCIVCDSRVYSDNSSSIPSNHNESGDENGEIPLNLDIQMSTSAFCSTACLITSYVEAASKPDLGPYQPSDNMKIDRIRKNQNKDYYVIYFNHSNKHSKTPMINKNCLMKNPSDQKISDIRKSKKILSDFTLTSYNSSSSTYSSS